MALRRRRVFVAAYNRNPAVRRRAVRHGAASRVYPSAGEAARGADVVVICVPIPAMPAIMREAGLSAPRAVVTDVGSAKQAVLGLAARFLPGPSRFVGGHPMAGSERSGLPAARPDLFRGRTCVLTPSRSSRPGAAAAVAGMWRACGARVMLMDAARHDRMVARISHLPHALALALVGMVSGDRDSRAAAAGSFLDATRVSLSDPEMWRGIFEANRTDVLRALSGFSGELARVRRAVSSRDGSGLLRMLRRAQAVRGGMGRAR